MENRTKYVVKTLTECVIEADWSKSDDKVGNKEVHLYPLMGGNRVLHRCRYTSGSDM